MVQISTFYLAISSNQLSYTGMVMKEKLTASHYEVQHAQLGIMVLGGIEFELKTRFLLAFEPFIKYQPQRFRISPYWSDARSLLQTR